MNQLQAFKRLKKLAGARAFSVQKEFCSWYKEVQWILYIGSTDNCDSICENGPSLMELFDKVEAQLKRQKNDSGS